MFWRTFGAIVLAGLVLFALYTWASYRWEMARLEAYCERARQSGDLGAMAECIRTYEGMLERRGYSR